MHSTPGSIRKLKTRRSKLWPPARRGAAHLSQAQGCRLHESQLLPEKWWCSHRHHHHHGHQRYIESRRGCLQTPRGSGSPSWVFMKGGTFMCRIWLLHMLQGTNQGNQSESCPNHGPPRKDHLRLQLSSNNPRLPQRWPSSFPLHLPYSLPPRLQSYLRRLMSHQNWQRLQWGQRSGKELRRRRGSTKRPKPTMYVGSAAVRISQAQGDGPQGLQGIFALPYKCWDIRWLPKTSKNNDCWEKEGSTIKQL